VLKELFISCLSAVGENTNSGVQKKKKQKRKVIIVVALFIQIAEE
jgi:hypothetical protein